MIKRAIILAGGEGTRLRPLTLETPKPLVTVQGVPIASWLTRLFRAHGVEQITVVYPKKWKEKFLAWAKEEGVDAFEEKEPMGTMGALVHEFDFGNDPIFVTNGDELKGLDLAELVKTHERIRVADPSVGATIALVRVQNPSEYGVAEMEGDHITRFHEKPEVPPTTLISSGLYIIEPSVFAEISKEKKFLMFEKDLFPMLAAAKRLAGCPLDGAWYDCGTMERWEKAIREWKG